MAGVVNTENMVHEAVGALVRFEDQAGKSVFNGSGELITAILILMNSSRAYDQMLSDFPGDGTITNASTENAGLMARNFDGYPQSWNQQIAAVLYNIMTGTHVDSIAFITYFAALFNYAYQEGQCPFKGEKQNIETRLNAALSSGAVMEDHDILLMTAVFWKDGSFRSVFMQEYKAARNAGSAQDNASAQENAPAQDTSPADVTSLIVKAGNKAAPRPADHGNGYRRAIEFNPKPALGENTNGVGVVVDMFHGEGDCPLLTQSTGALHSMATGFQGYMLLFMKCRMDDKTRAFYGRYEQLIKEFAMAVAEFSGKDYDEIFFDGGEPVAYRGWRLERLSRVESYGSSSAETLYMDYCLGADGGLYMVISDGDSLRLSDTEVINCLIYNSFDIDYKRGDMLTGALSGCLGVLDTVPMDPNDPDRNVLLRIPNDDDYLYNFRYGISDGKEFSYNVWEGLIERLARLLTYEEKLKCMEKYSWTKDLLA